MKKNILFVSIAFPPKSDPEALQTAKYFHYLQKHKELLIDVVTSDIPTLYMPYDQDLEAYTKGINQLISISLKENRYVNFALNRLGLQGMVFPDVKQSFHKQFDKVIKQLKNKPDLIYSRAYPNSSTIMAYKLKQLLKVPWVLHMSDPWVDCPVKRMSGSFYKKNDEWEKKCFEAADIISLTSIPTIDFYKKKYPNLTGKFRFYPNVYELTNDEEHENTKNKKDDKIFRVVYTGGMADARTPEFFLKPLSELYKNNPDISNELEVIIAGEADSRNRAILHNYNLPFVKFLGKVSFKEALQLQRSADYLIAIDFIVKEPEKAMFFLSKLLDYMVARKRILTLTIKGSASDQVMQDLKGDVCDHNDTEAIKEAFIKALDAFAKKDHNYLVNTFVPQKYEASYNTDRLYHDMMELMNINDYA